MATLGLAATKPGTALGGRSRSQMNNNNPTTNLESMTRERSMVSQVHVINEAPSNVSSMPDFDILYDELCGSPVEDKSVGDVFAELEKEDLERKKKGGSSGKEKASIVKLFSTSGGSSKDNKGGSIKPKAVYDKNKSTTTKKSTTSTSTGGDAPSVRFTSDAANNYYQAMKFGKTKLHKMDNTTKSGGGGGASPTEERGVSDYLNLLRDKKLKDNEVEQQKKKKTRDEIINECLSKSKTPMEISEYILNECGEQLDKMELYTIILKKQKEQQAKHAENARRLQEERERAVLEEEERSSSIIETGGKLGTSSMKQRKDPPATLKLQTRSEQLLESVKQASAAAQQQSQQQQPLTVPSSQSMLSDLSPRSVFSAACSIATEYVPSGLSPSGLSPPTSPPQAADDDNIIIDTRQKSVKQLKQRYETKNKEDDELYDPPISEYPSPGTGVGSPTTTNEDGNALGYPDNEDGGATSAMMSMMNPSVMALLEKVGLPDSLSPKPTTTKSSKNKSKRHPEIMSPGAQEYAKNGIELVLSRYNNQSLSSSNDNVSSSTTTSSSNDSPISVTSRVVTSTHANKAAGSIVTEKRDEFTLPLSPPPARRSRSPTSGNSSTTSSSGNGNGTSCSSGGNKIRSASPILLANKLKNKILPRGSSSDDYDNKLTIDDEAKVEALAAASAEEEGGTKNSNKMSKSSNKKSGTKKGLVAKKKVLPPRIPTRPIVPPVDPPPSEEEERMVKRVTTNDISDDGSVECSVWKNVDVTNAIVEEEELEVDDKDDDDETKVQFLPTDPDGVSAMNAISSSVDDASVEVTSLFDHTTQGDDRYELKLLTTVAKIDSPPGPKDKKKSRMALARQKLSRGGSKKKDSVDGSDEAAAAYSAGTTSATASVHNTKTSVDNSNNDSSTVTSTTSSIRLRKKEKMKKIMEYRKKASPSLKLDGWKGLTENKKREEEMSRVELLELLKKEREAAQAAASVAVAAGGEDGYSKSSSMSDIKHPVKQVNVYPNASEYDDNEDMTMPPELQESKKIDIWTEKNVGESFDREGVTNKKKRETDLAQAFMSCGERILDGDTVYDENTLADDATDTVADKTNNLKEGDTRADSPAGGGTKRFFVCGIDPEDLGLDSKIGRDLAYEAKEVVRDLKSGVKKSIRSIFGACDITQDGGVDFITKNVDTAKDQLLGKVPLSPKKRTSSTARSSTASSPENHTGPTATATMKAATDNPQAEKITEILDGTDAARKHFENVYTSNQEEEIEQSAELQELMKKEKAKPLTEKEKRELYMKKLKSVSLKHL